MAELFSFFLIIASGLLLSQTFERLHLPYVTALIVAGMLVGPVFGLVEINPTIVFIGSIGIIFLMFIAGSEIKLKSFSNIGREVIILALLNGLIPFAVGTGIGLFFGFSIFTSLVLGIIFISSAIAVILPTLEANNMTATKVGELIISSTVLEDLASLLLLAVVLQSVAPKSVLPIPIYLVLIVLVIVILKKIVPALQKLFQHNKVASDIFESDLRFVLSTLIATVLLFELIGMHAIIAGFVIGVILGDSMKGKVEEKIRTVSYGIFIPTFFLIIGMQTDLGVFTDNNAIPIAIVIVLGLFVAKIGSGMLAGKIIGLQKEEGLLIGVASTPQLSTTLAAAFAALELGLLNQTLIAALVILTIVTTFIAPLAVKKLVERNSIQSTEFFPW
jgi:Kef-type K+ transport system membrane component KefB